MRAVFGRRPFIRKIPALMLMGVGPGSLSIHVKWGQVTRHWRNNRKFPYTQGNISTCSVVGSVVSGWAERIINPRTRRRTGTFAEKWVVHPLLY